MGDRVFLLVDQYLGELIGQFVGEGDLVGLLDVLGIYVFEIEDVHYFVFDMNVGIEY